MFHEYCYSQTTLQFHFERQSDLHECDSEVVHSAVSCGVVQLNRRRLKILQCATWLN